MKTRFKYVTLMASALVLGLSSCSNDNEAREIDDTTFKSVTIHISNPSTYAEEATAIGKTPALNDINVYFVGGGIVRAVGTMTSGEVGAPKTFSGVPGSATKVVIIANGTALVSPAVATVAVNDSETKLNALMFEQDKQTNPTSAVNVYGSAAITGPVGAEVAAITLAPAISRIEIAEVKANAAAAIPLDNFKLAGIYINNAYTECGTDYTTLPAAPADILNYEGSDVIWDNGLYPARFCQEWAAPVAATSFIPAAGTLWSYYVMPVVAGKGTIINAVQQASVPHIVLKITDAAAVGYVLPATAYVTIKEIQVLSVSLTELERGKVYSIANIAIGGENLSATPEVPATQNVSVTATLTPWVNQPVTPIVP